MQAQILDIAFIAGAGKCRLKKRSAFSQWFCFSFHPSVSSPFRYSSSVIYSTFIDMKSHLIISSQLYF
jgi:hypothetical protein